MKFHLIVFLVTLLSLLPFESLGQEEGDLEYVLPRIALKVSGDESVVTRVESYSKAELRALGDIVIVDPDADRIDLLVSIIAGEQVNLLGNTVGYTLSAVFLYPFPPDKVDTYFWGVKYDMEHKWNATDAEFERLEGLVKSIKLESQGLYWFAGHWLRNCPADGLRHGCEDLVADVDVQFIEPRRELHQKRKDLLHDYDALYDEFIRKSDR